MKEIIMKKLKILGLGRCIIGHLEKSIKENYSNEITFKHHYLLNYETCLNSTFEDNSFCELSKITCVPPLDDQLLCLEDISNYDICAIEVFPPALLYKKENIFACFENFTNELEQSGFKLSNQKQDTYNEQYIFTIENLIKKIQQIHSQIKIILVNGEIANEEEKVGSTRLLNLLNSVRKSKILRDKNIRFLDMNTVIDNLSSQEQSSYEIAFPHIYLRHAEDLSLIAVSRDTKHATPHIRKVFLKYFCDIIKEFAFNSPQIPIELLRLDYLGKNLKVRAKNYLTTRNNENQLLEELENSKTFSLYVTYAISTEDIFASSIITKFLDRLALIELSPKELKYYFYHLRTLCAFGLSNQKDTILQLVTLGNNLLFLQKEELESCSNFVLLWIKNIYLVYSNSEKSLLPKELKVFFVKLAQNEYLLSFDEIKIILKNTEQLLSQNDTIKGT